MDIVDRHFAAENAHDVKATLATYTDGIVWDDVTHPSCPVHGKDATASIYGAILSTIPDIHLDSVRRFTADNGGTVVDEAILTGHVHGSWAGIEGEGAPIRIRILHIFDIANGLITRENTWFDSAAIIRQIQDFKSMNSGATLRVD
jgi:steroid delta-isomerase-like uncharacterized protein